MFDKNGNWKEFGFINDTKHTWFPFWLFCIIWAILSYAVTKFLFNKESTTLEVNLKNTSKSNSMKSGYYVLDKTTAEGIPKYVYLGPDNPVNNE
jgi:hypothetical protein